MAKKLTDVQVLSSVSIGVKTLAKDKAVEMPQYFVRGRLMEEYFKLGNQVSGISVDLQ